LNPLHVSSNFVFVLRRTIVLIQLSSLGWAQSCSKRVEDSNKHIIEEVVHQVGHLSELYNIICYYLTACYKSVTLFFIHFLSAYSLIVSSNCKDFVISFPLDRIERCFRLSSSIVDRNLFFIICSLRSFSQLHNSLLITSCKFLGFLSILEYHLSRFFHI
jgi:hypothetical protein